MTTPHEPMQFAGCYTLHLYCDSPDCSRPLQYGTACGEFTGETFTECARRATRQGWKIHKETRTATCPACLKARTK